MGAIMIYRYNVSCCKSTSKFWTRSAIECYELGCNCSKCNIYKIYFANSLFKCKMKETVIELVRKKGIPKLSEEQKYEKSCKY